MQLNEFAKLILLSPEIEAKLFLPDRVSDDDTIEPEFEIPSLPVRNKPLDVLAAGRNQPFPSAQKMSDPQMRGIALHSFVNHELLALELMALMLLRFPKAPARYRQSLLATMLDEQSHCRLYLKRMNDLGIKFGELNPNYYFWNELSRVSSLSEFVAGMSLTFEQANLDFSRYYQELFNRLNDDTTSEIMKKVYEDEVNHVRTGLQWFRKWRPSDVDEWDHYCSSLPGNLTPARAKGLEFDIQSRKRAGFTDEFINRLSVFSRSKGRHPDIFFFFPDSEREYTNNSVAHNPRATIEILRRDLSSVMHIVTDDSNAVLVERQPSLKYLQNLHESGFPIPDFLTKHELLSNPKIQKFARVVPWAICLSTERIAAEIRQKITQANFEVTLETAQLVNAKAFSQRIENEFHSISEMTRPLSKSITIDSLGSALAELRMLTQNGDRAVIKCNHASSGQGNRIVSKNEIESNSLAGWIQKALNEQSLLIVERWLDKVLDLSIHYECQKDNSVKLQGVTPFFTTSRGQYVASLIGSRSLATAISGLKSLNASFNPQLTLKGIEDAARFSAQHLTVNGYVGPSSNDCFLFQQTESGQTKIYLRPVVEINARMTMGKFALRLNQRVCTSSVGIMRLLNQRSVGQWGFSSLTAMADDLLNRSTRSMVTNGNRQVVSEGAVLLSDPYTSTDFMLVLVVGKTLGELAKAFPEFIEYIPEWLVKK